MTFPPSPHHIALLVPGVCDLSALHRQKHPPSSRINPFFRVLTANREGDFVALAVTFPPSQFQFYAAISPSQFQIYAPFPPSTDIITLPRRFHPPSSRLARPFHPHQAKAPSQFAYKPSFLSLNHKSGGRFCTWRMILHREGGSAQGGRFYIRRVVLWR